LAIAIVCVYVFLGFLVYVTAVAIDTISGRGMFKSTRYDSTGPWILLVIGFALWPLIVIGTLAVLLIGLISWIPSNVYEIVSRHFVKYRDRERVRFDDD
jgi:hypothetical protein